MEKSCEICYYRALKICGKCNNHSEFAPICDCCEYDEGMYELDGRIFCSDCISKHLNIDRVEISSYEFYFNNEYYGNDNDNEIDILQNINKNVKELEYW